MTGRLQTQRLLQRRNAAAGNGDLLVDAVEGKQKRAAGLGLDFLHQGEIDEVSAMNAEEAVSIEGLLELRETDRREEAIDAGLQIGVVITSHNETDVVDVDEDLLAALFNRDALCLLGLRVKDDVLANAGKCVGKALDLDGLDQVVDRVDLERIEGEFTVRRDEDDGRRVLQMLQRLGQLDSASWMPVASGMLMSRKTTSQGYSLSFSMASRTLAASATTSVWLSSPRRKRSSERAGASSSTMIAFSNGTSSFIRISSGITL